MTMTLTAAQVAAGFTLAGRRPTVGPLSTLAPVAPTDAGALLAGTGLDGADRRLTAAASAMFGVLGAPGRRITATVLTSVSEGVAITTFYAPAEGGPYVALARDGSGFALSTVGTGAEAASVVGAYLGLSAQPPPLQGGAAELPTAAWAVLGALAELDVSAADPAAIRRALGRRAGPVVQALRTIAPTGAADPGTKGVEEASRWLGGAGLVTRMPDDTLRLTGQGRAVTRALRQFTIAGSVTVDHMTTAGPVRAVSLSSIRSPERLLWGAWRVDERGPVIGLGEPGADEAATMLRTLVEAPSVFPVTSAPVPPTPPPAAS